MSWSARSLKRAAAMVAATLLLGVPAEAYYHYVYYVTHSAPFGIALVPVKFDLSRLPNNTVTFYVNDSGPATYAPNDSFGSILGEVKQALAAWNAVPTSSLRIAFGGIESASQNSNTPGGQVIFTDLPPGILGLGSPEVAGPGSMTQYPGTGLLVPINHSLVILSNNTALGAGPSYLESFFTTAVHEIGHALGLQHTWTGSAMSQGVIRDTSRARPLDSDDIASLSELYGAAGWTANYGSISGTVKFTNNQPVSLASVVAIAASGPAVSALTNPDGTYTINGLPPGSYQLYVHPLPPDAFASNGTGLQLPQDQSGVPFPSSNSFRSLFYPQTVDPNQARTFTINPGSSFGAADFSVTARSGVPAYNLVTYSCIDSNLKNYALAQSNNTCVWQTTAFVNSTQSQSLIYAVANTGTTAFPNSVNLMGIGSATPQSNGKDSGMFLFFNMSSAATGPRHLVFNYGNDMYVLPNGVNLVQNGPPYINSAAPNGDGSVTISGSNFGPDSRVFFDGLPAAGTYNAASNSITVTPPAAPSGQLSTITVFDSDGQNSMFLQQQNPPTYTYPSSPSPQIQTVTPSSMPAGIPGVPYTAMVDIKGVNTQFADGQVTVGFGTSDVTVSRVWVLSPTHLIANVVVASGAAIGSSEISVISGFNVLVAPVQFQIQPANATLPMIGTVVNPVNGQSTLFPGGFGVVYGLNLAASPTSVQVTLNGTPLGLQFAGAGQVNFVLPSNFPTGPAQLTINTGSGNISFGVAVANPPVTIQGAANAGTTSIAAALNGAVPFFNPGDTINVQVSGLDPTVAGSPGRVQVTVSGLPMTVTQVTANQVQFVLGQSFGGAQVPVVVLVDGSASAAFTIGAR